MNEMSGLFMRGDRRVEVVQAALPHLEEGEVLVRVRASALCGSERYSYLNGCKHGNSGHEVCGVVESVRGTHRLKVGDHVGVHAINGCGKCLRCLQGRPTWCDRRGLTTDAAGNIGGHAQFIRAPEIWCYRLDPAIPFAIGALLTGDGLGVPYHANLAAATHPGDRVCILGAGPVGLGNVLVQNFYGVRVAAVDLNPHRLVMARQCGAELTINAVEIEVEQAIADWTGGEGVAVAFECTGQASAVKQALQIVRPGGRVICIGEQGAVPIDVSTDLIRRDIQLRGSWFYHFREIPEIVKLYESGLRADLLITNSFLLDDAQTAFDRFFGGQEGKVVLTP